MGSLKQKEAHWMAEAPRTERTAGLAPGNYSATENVLVLLLNVLGKYLNNICASVTITQSKHVWTLYN